MTGAVAISPDKKIPEHHQETATFRGSGVAVLFPGENLGSHLFGILGAEAKRLPGPGVPQWPQAGFDCPGVTS
jgi:hypothetical protein